MTGDDALSDERVLLVEGRDDKHVVLHLCQADASIRVPRVIEKDGIERLLDGIRGEILAEGRVAVGILVDANDDLQARWQAVANRLRDAGITPPAAPALGGTIIDGSPRVGVWLMPDNQSPGELEDFIAKMIPSGDPVWPLSKDYIERIPEDDRKFRPGKILRAKVHAWLAARERPRLLGQAIRTGDLRVDGAEAQLFVRWLRELFK